MRTSTVKIGEHRGNGRIWLQGQWLHDYGFVGGDRIDITYTEGRITITLGTKRKITKKGPDAAIIDLCSGKVRQAFPTESTVLVTVQQGQIDITAEAD